MTNVFVQLPEFSLKHALSGYAVRNATEEVDMFTAQPNKSWAERMYCGRRLRAR